MVAQVTYLFKNKGILKFIYLGQTCITLLMSCVFCQRTTLPMLTTYHGILKDFISKFHLTHHKHTSEFSLHTYNRVNKLCEMATIIQHIQLFTSALMFNIGPIYSNYKSGMFSSDEPVNGTFEHSVSYALPFAQNNKAWYTVICLYNFYVSYNVGCMFCCHDLLICLIVFHIWGHLNIFEHNLNFFPRPNTDDARTVPLRYSYEENKQVAQRLQDIVKYYIIIKEFLANTSSAYSVTLCVYYGFHLVSDCVLLLECSTLDPGAVATYGLLTLVVYQQLIQLSVIFELISSKTDPLVNAVYGLPWECMDNSNRRTVLILLQTVQQSLALKACNMVPVGVQTMQAQIKWMCSI
ncbi:uncharacterized protein isoform X2 [Choristoneura fumiferana]